MSENGNGDGDGGDDGDGDGDGDDNDGGEVMIRTSRYVRSGDDGCTCVRMYARS